MRADITEQRKSIANDRKLAAIQLSFPDDTLFLTTGRDDEGDTDTPKHRPSESWTHRLSSTPSTLFKLIAHASSVRQRSAPTGAR